MAAHTKKISIAIEQIEDAVDLFFEERYLSSITLLGAAEEILATAIEKDTGHNILHGEWEHLNNFRSKIGRPHISKGKLKKTNKAAYNTVKHYDLDDDDRMYISRFGEAFMLIQKVTNYADHLNLKYSNRNKYRKWYNENWGA